MNAPTIPVSWAELFDKIAILEIKTQRLHSHSAAANAAHELGLLRDIAARAERQSGVAELCSALLAVNTRLWRIEELIREHERTRCFDASFIALARAVYRENDERGRIKQALNRLLRSALVEEKQYPGY